MPPTPSAGKTRKLVLAFDIGTTFSGVCYTFFDPGRSIETKPVTTFLNNEHHDFKIPSILYYDEDGKFRGAGSPAANWDDLDALDQIRWWKLKLAKGELPPEAKRHMTADLPAGKTIIDLYSDFIRYLFDSTIAHIKQAEPTGEVLWKNFEPTMEIVLAHPNGWKGPQQKDLRNAVVKSGIFTEEEARSRVTFVTEGEASFNYCVTTTESGKSLKVDHKVIVIDAGGGTIDVSSYTVRGVSPLKVEELYTPKCAYQGAEFVTARARDCVYAKFKGSKFEGDEDLDAFAKEFDKGLKVSFTGDSKPQSVKFGSMRDNDSSCDVKGGILKLQGARVAEFFKPSIDAVMDAIKGFVDDLNPENTFVFLVGGFAGSPWLFKEISRELGTFGLKLARPDTHTNKAVAFGAISYHLNHFVTSRIAEYTYGAFGCVDFDASDSEHRKRTAKKRLSPTGEFILDAFIPILFKGTKVSDTQEFSDTFASMCPFPPGAFGSEKRMGVVRYKGEREKPQWVDLEEGNFETICHIEVNPKDIPFFPFMSPLGFPCFIQAYEVVYFYGSTEFKAQVRWKDMDDETKWSEAKIIYDEPPAL